MFARRIVGWRVSNSVRTDFVLVALEQALYARQPNLPFTNTRYDKTARNFLGAIHLAATMVWLA